MNNLSSSRNVAITALSRLRRIDRAETDPYLTRLHLGAA